MLACNSYVAGLHAYDFVIKDFVINRAIICARPCILEIKPLCEVLLANTVGSLFLLMMVSLVAVQKLFNLM